MAFWKSVGKNIGDMGQKVAAKTRNYTDVARVGTQVSNLEKQIQQSYLDLGKAYYAAHKEDVQPEFPLSQLTENLQELDALRAQLKQLKGIVPCPHCGADCSENDAYCSACGQKTGFGKAQPVCPHCGKPVVTGSLFCPSCGAGLAHEIPAKPAEGQRICPHCGEMTPADMAFCTKCGEKIPEAPEEAEE